jgi:bifunctional non-homologous end joining protein LigD
LTKRRFGRYTVETSNEEKVLFPDDGVTKGELIDYYSEIADVMLPHLKDRPLVMQRFPNGIDSSGFYQKDASEYFPQWISTKRVRKKGGSVNHVICDKRATLAYLANQATITLHTWTSRADKIYHPDQMIFDLDPISDQFAVARETAELLFNLLDELGLRGFIKTTGSKGLHVVVPIDRSADFDEVRAFAFDVAKILEARDPERLTIETRKAKRNGRLFLDVGRNAYAQHAVAPYSLRPRPGAPVAAPIHREELREVDSARFSIATVRKRVAEGDPWSGMARGARSLRAPRRLLASLLETEQGGAQHQTP